MSAFESQNTPPIIRLVAGSETGSALNRYGFLHDTDVPTKQLSDTDLGDVLPELTCSPKQGSVSFKPDEDEDWIGFGDVTRERMYHRGHTIDCWVKNVKSYVPVPLFLSTRGYAVLVNSTHRVMFDVCASDENVFSWRDHSGRVDFYLLRGGSFLENIRLYTELTGKPMLPPEWSFGLWYICREQANDYEAVNDALNFRREEIPCDVIGLEPGWMEEEHDLLSVDKRWSKERFPIPRWCPNGPHNFLDAIRRMGFHFELWERNEYDLSYEEERRMGRQVDTSVKETGNFQAGAEVDLHFSWPRNFDKITKKDEPWFEHHKKFIDQGADFFKMDGSYQVCEHPGRVWGNGMLDEEMHNLYPLLYSRQMQEGLLDYRKKRPVVFTVAGWTGFQAYSGTWSGDTGGRLETLGGMLNTAVMSHNWITNDMEVIQPEGIHFGYLQPWSQINSWTYFRMPWIQGEELCNMHKAYSRLRSRLIPYIYSWAWQTAKKGLPLLMRPLQIEFEDDPACRDVMHEYLLGRDLLVSIYKHDVYLPAGRWQDFWTGKIYDGGKTHDIDWPEDRGGGLFVREGAIIPFGPLMQYRRQKPLDRIELRLFPSAEESTFALYEDDGDSLDCQDGVYATTEISTIRKGNTIEINVSDPQGPYEDLPRNRRWSFSIIADQRPDAIRLNGEEVQDWEKAGISLLLPQDT